MTFGSRLHTRAEPSPMSRRGFLIGASAAGLGLAAFAATRGRHEFEIVHRTFAIANLPDAFQNFRVVQISDIHLEEYTEAWYLEEMVRQTNALQPDLVLLTGDFISRGPLATEVAWHSAGVCAEVLSLLTAPQRLAILGNHDVAVGASRVIDPLVAHGTPVLVNSHIALERGGDRVWICGLDDVEGGHPDFDVTLPDDPRAPVLLMVHEPDFVQRILLHPRLRLVDLMLAGHSHGGQIRLPFAGPLILPPLGKLYPEGLYRFGHTQMYVNRGIGTVGMPFRFNCPSELTHITLVRA